MSHKNEKAASEKISRKSVQTNAAESSQEQPTSRPDGTTSEIASDVAGTEATTIKSQSIAAAETPVAMPVPAIAPCGTNVPYVFRETNYEPPDEVKTEEVRLLSHDDLLTGLKRQYDFTRQSHMGFRHDLTKLVHFYDAVVDRFKDQYVAGDKRDGKPTLRESFYAIGWNYDAARKMRQRFNTNALPDHASPPKPLQLTEGDVVKTNDGDKGVVTHVHESAPKVDVVFEGDTEAVTESTKGLIKVKPSVRKVKIGDLFLFEDKQAEYVYKGDGKFSRTETPTLILQKRYADAAKLQAKKDRQDAAAAEKAKEKERRQAEAQRRTEEKMMKRAEDARRVLEKKEARAAAKAAKKSWKKTAAERSAKASELMTAVGDKCEPTAHGFFWEFRKHDKAPYIVRDLNNPDLGILVECPSKVTAEMMVWKYEQDTASAAA